MSARQYSQSSNGLIYGSLIILSWGSISLLLKLVHTMADPVTLTWLRFAVAGVFMFALQSTKGELRQFRSLTLADWCRLVLASLGLIGNYVCASWGVAYLPPEAAMLILQLSPIFLAVGGRFFLGERVTPGQWACFASIFLGLMLFLHRAIASAAFGQSAMTAGVFIMLASAVSWSLFALLQKTIMRRVGPSNVLLGAYWIAVVLLTPVARFGEFSKLDGTQLELVIACCLDTVLAYWSFTQALRYLETVKVSAIIALSPVAAFILSVFVVWLGLWRTQIAATPLDILTVLGMTIVVASAMAMHLVRASPFPANANQGR